MTAILLVGLPRSGSTWAAEVLSRTEGTSLVHEPDDAYRWPEALRAKLALGDYPTPPAASNSRAFRQLWLTAAQEPERFSRSRSDLATRAIGRLPNRVVHKLLGNGRRHGHRKVSAPDPVVPTQYRPTLYKSVGLPLCTAVVAAWLGARVVVIRRDLGRVVASWARTPGFRPEPLHSDPWVRREVIERHGLVVPSLGTRVRQIAWTVGLLDLALRSAVVENNWECTTHEALLESPEREFDRVARRLGLASTESMWKFIEANRRLGTGYDLSRTDDQLRRCWQGQFSPEQRDEITAVLSAFEPGPWAGHAGERFRLGGTNGTGRPI